MISNIEELITTNYELEGLLYLALHRGDDTPQQVWEMISEKIDFLKSAANPSVPDADTHAEEILTPTEEHRTEPEPITEGTETDEPCPQPEPEIVAAVTDEPCPQTEPQIEAAVTDEPCPQPEPEIVAAVTDEPCPQPEAEKEPEPEIPESVSSTPDNKQKEATESLRLDEKLARQYSRDLDKAFSLNDRFRFKRELFDNSNEKMNSALELVKSMTSINEARDYFYTEMGLDKTSADVSDFMAIIEHHISAK